jgi:hypothetical protein
MSLGPTGNEKSHIYQGVTITGGFAHEGPGSSSGNVRRSVYLTNDTSATLVRQQALMEAQGYYAETFPRAALGGSSTIMVDGTVYFNSIGLVSGDVVTSITTFIATGGAGMSICKVGLYSKTGTLLASSADASTSFNSAGLKTTPLSTPYTVTSTDGCFVALFGKTATTMPTPHRTGVSVNGNGLPIGLGMIQCGLMAGQTDLPANATISGVGTTISYWAGLS